MAANPSDQLTVALAQIAPLWLDRQGTLDKVMEYVVRAAGQGCQLVAFSEALVPGYPFWLELTDAARFNSPLQKEIHAHYLAQAVQIEAGHLDALRAAAARAYRCTGLHRAPRRPRRAQPVLLAGIYRPAG
jgi:nitrilase